MSLIPEQLSPGVEPAVLYHRVELVLVRVVGVELLEVMGRSEHVAVQQGHVGEHRLERDGKVHLDRVVVHLGPLHDLAARHQAVVDPGRDFLVQQEIIVPEHHVVRAERGAVRPSHAAAQRHGKGLAVRRERVALDHVRYQRLQVRGHGEEALGALQAVAFADAHHGKGHGVGRPAVLPDAIHRNHHYTVSGQPVLHRGQVPRGHARRQHGRLLEARDHVSRHPLVLVQVVLLGQSGRGCEGHHASQQTETCTDSQYSFHSSSPILISRDPTGAGTLYPARMMPFVLTSSHISIESRFARQLCHAHCGLSIPPADPRTRFGAERLLPTLPGASRHDALSFRPV